MQIISEIPANQHVVSVTQGCYGLLFPEHLEAPFGGERDIRIVHDQRYPIVYSDQSDTSVWKVGITVDYPNDPLRTIYQVAHEICHLAIGHHTNGVFIEVLCQMMAYQGLKSIGGSYVTEQQSLDYATLNHTQISQGLRLNDEQIKERYRTNLDKGLIDDRTYNDVVARRVWFLAGDSCLELVKHVRSALIIQEPDKENLNVTVDFDVLAEKCEAGKRIRHLFT
jgi:hypothetical protein